MSVYEENFQKILSLYKKTLSLAPKRPMTLKHEPKNLALVYWENQHFRLNF